MTISTYHKQKPLHQALLNQNGAALLFIIVSMIILASLSVAMVRLSSTSNMNPISNNAANRAFYLAEAGFRYTAVKYSQDPTTMNSLDNTTFSVGSGANQNFTLQLAPYLFQVIGGNGTRRLRTQVPFGSAPNLSTGPGYVKVGGRAYEPYNSLDIRNGNEIRFIKNAPATWNVAIGETVELTVLNNGSYTLTSGGNLILQPNNAVDTFPNQNGRISINNTTYRYTRRDSNMLVGIFSTDGSPINIILNNNDQVVLEPFLQVQSTGSYGTGSFSATRLVTYHVPLSLGGTGAPQEWNDPFDDTDDWDATAEGSHAVAAIGGDNALNVTGTTRIPRTQLDTSAIYFDWAAAGVPLDQAWADNGNMLSYDVQVKIKVVNEPYYMAGISFRVDNSDNHYGVSFAHTAPDGADGIWDGLMPIPGQPMIILWERDGAIWGADTKWLAYKTLNTSDFVEASSIYFEDDFESGLGKWTTVDSPGALTTSTYHSFNHCWTDSPAGNYARNVDVSIVSQSLDLSAATVPVLSFWHRYDIRANQDWGRVRISVNNGAWTTLQQFQRTQNSWINTVIDLSAYAGQSNVRISFLLYSHNDRRVRDGWYVDDVSVHEQGVNWPTLMVKVEEKTATSGVFSGQKVNDIQVYFGDINAHGTANTDPLDNNRLDNPRGQIHWPPEDVADTDATNDYYTLVQWNANIDGSVERLGTGTELNTIIRSNTLTTPAGGTFAQPEIALHTWGWSSTSVYFDDFAIRLPGSGSAGTPGFLPAVQE